MNHREVLGVSPSASKTEIKKAFREAAKELHPDHSDSPEAAEAFKRIKEAHDALIKDAGAPRESATVSASSARSAASTAQAAYSFQQAQPQLTDEELKHIQDLDQKVRQEPVKKSFFRRTKESVELRRHRKKLKTNEQRISGKY